MEVQMLQIPVFDFDAHGMQTVVDGYFVLTKLVAITPTLTGGANIVFEGEHAWETPVSPEILVEHIYAGLKQIYGGEYKTFKTKIKEEE